MKTETLQQMTAIQNGTIVSKVLTQTGSVTLFALGKGEAISAHTSDRDALAIVLEGQLLFEVDKEQKDIHAMESVELPANVYHALQAVQDSRMLLIQKGE